MTANKLVSASVLTVALLFGGAAARADHISQVGIKDCQLLISEPVYGLIEETEATWFGGKRGAKIRDGLVMRLENADFKLSEAIFLLKVGKSMGVEGKTADAGGKLVDYKGKMDSLPTEVDVGDKKKKVEAKDQAYLSAEAQTAIECVADLLIHE